MSQNALRERYLSDSVNTASPHRLLTMLYDRLVLDLERSSDALAAKDYPKANDELQHAQAIVLELKSSIRPEVWKGAENLTSLLTWMYSELLAANLEKSASKVKSVTEVAEVLRQTIHEAADLVSKQ